MVPVAVSASVKSSVKESAPELHTCCAPAERSNCSCSLERTMLNKGDAVREAEAVEHLTEIDAAAVWTSAVWPSRCIVPTWPSKVGGLTKHDAPSTAVTPPGSSRHCDTSTQRCCDYIAPSSRPSVLPSSACADADEPATTTLPAPSFPTRE
jgi:hypothetical protein